MTLRMVCDGCGTSISPSTTPTLVNGLVFHARCIINGEKELVSYLSRIGEVKNQLRDDGGHRWWSIPSNHRAVTLEIGNQNIVISYVPGSGKWYIWIPLLSHERVCKFSDVGVTALKDVLRSQFNVILKEQ